VGSRLKPVEQVNREVVEVEATASHAAEIPALAVWVAYWEGVSRGRVAARSGPAERLDCEGGLREVRGELGRSPNGRRGDPTRRGGDARGPAGRPSRNDPRGWTEDDWPTLQEDVKSIKARRSARREPHPPDGPKDDLAEAVAAIRRRMARGPESFPFRLPVGLTFGEYLALLGAVEAAAVALGRNPKGSRLDGQATLMEPDARLMFRTGEDGEEERTAAESTTDAVEPCIVASACED